MKPHYTPLHSPFQHTIAKSVAISGIGLHSGEKVKMVIRPSDEGTGIVFRRRDMAAHKAEIKAHYSNIFDTTLGTSIRNSYGASVATIEHLMAALWGCGVDNAVIEIDGPEVPIMDGSSKPFVEWIERAGLVAQEAPRRKLRILSPVMFSENGNVLRFEPAKGFQLSVDIEFESAAIAHQHCTLDFNRLTFKDAISEARTFGMASDLPKMRALGLAKGGSLENAILVDGDKVVNEEGLRFDDEFVRHKALDCVGDLYLAGYRIEGRIIAMRPGHAVNAKALKALFDSPNAWTIDPSVQIIKTPAVAETRVAAFSESAYI